MAGKLENELRPHSPTSAVRAPDEHVPADVLADLDTQLMLQVRDGNSEAAGTLVRRNRDRIARYLARLVRDARSVEDLTQDVFLQALAHAEHYRPTARVITWLYRIATNTALNYLKQAGVQRRAAEPAETALNVPDAHEPTPDRQMSLDELRQQVAGAVLSLPVNQRIALTLFEYEGCTYEQIAAVLDVTVESVRSLLMRARTTLRRELRGLL